MGSVVIAGTGATQGELVDFHFKTSLFEAGRPRISAQVAALFFSMEHCPGDILVQFFNAGPRGISMFLGCGEALEYVVLNAIFVKPQDVVAFGNEVGGLEATASFGGHWVDGGAKEEGFIPVNEQATVV